MIGVFVAGMMTGIAISVVVLFLIADRYDRPRPFR